jgi:hypothetical protein
MNWPELRHAVDGLFAWDTGCRSSGIHDPDLKDRVRVALIADGALITRFILEMINPKTSPYTYEDVWEFLNWLNDELDFGL